MFVVSGANVNVSNGGAFTITEIDVANDYAVKQYSMTNQTGVTLRMFYSRDNTMCYDGYIYLMPYSGILGAFSLSTDKKMVDGNLVVAGSEGLKSHYYYTEPVGFIFRREMIFDDERLADSLSKIYDLNFHAQKADNGDTVFVSAEYPDLEIKIIRYGCQTSPCRKHLNE